MNITVTKATEHKDGSATLEFVYDKEAHHILLRHGLMAILTAVAAQYKPKSGVAAKKKVVKKKVK